MPKRLLLLMTAATYRAQAFLEAAARLGLRVAVACDRPLAISALNPDGALTLDFRAPDEAVEEIAEYSRAHPVDAVVAAEDEGVVLAAMAAQALGLPHNPVESIRALRDKHRTRQILSLAGLPSPPFACFTIDEEPEALSRQVDYPCVLKPLFLSASRGVIRADNPDEFRAAFSRVRSLLRLPEVAEQGGELARRVLVEGFIPGREVAVEGLFSRGRLHLLAIFDKPDPLDGPTFEETIYVTPSRLPREDQTRIEGAVQQAARAFHLEEGPVHAELRMNEQGPRIVEIAPRTIGGLCSRTLRFGEGISLEELVLRHALGLEFVALRREARAAGVMMIPTPQAGVLTGVRGRAAARSTPGVEEVIISVPIGQELVPLPEGARYLGFIFARGETPQAVERALRTAYGRLRFQITAGA